MKKKILILIPIVCYVIIIAFAIILINNKKEPFPFDEIVRDSFYKLRGPKETIKVNILWILSDIFGKYFIIGFSLLYIFLKRFKLKGWLIGLGALGNYLANTIIKLSINRIRPNTDMQWAEESSSSFPSGHAMSSMYIYTFLSYLIYQSNFKKRTKMLLIGISSIIILWVGVSRMILGVHYFSDVIIGYIGGLASFFVILLVYKSIYVKEGNPDDQDFVIDSQVTE